MNPAMVGIAPGSILQYMYLRERIRRFRRAGPLRTFVDCGSGGGYLSRILLEEGLTGTGLDLNEAACSKNSEFNRAFVEEGSYKVNVGDFVELDLPPVDLVVSSMVIEHLPDEARRKFFEKAKSALNSGGVIVTLVPASMKYWNIEDEIAGHLKRYERKDLEAVASEHELRVVHMAGLTYPLSNWLFGLSNLLVRRHEGSKMSLSLQDRTVESGDRKVPMKTSFPRVLSIVLNPVALYHFHVLQKLNSANENSMVLYCEMQPT